MLEALGLLSLGAALPQSSSAQSPWPSKSIRFVVPFAPGGNSEIVSRSTAAELSNTLGKSVYVDNKPGAAGNIAMQKVARADDQHTLILGHLGISRFVCVGAPRYFEQHGTPARPEDIAQHACLLHRFPSTGLLEKWCLRRGDEAIGMRPAASMTSNHLETLRHMAIQGHGVAYLPDFAVKSALDRGELVTALDEWTGAAAENWQACDRCPRYQTLTCYLAKRPLCASNRKLAASQCARQPERQLS